MLKLRKMRTSLPDEGGFAGVNLSIGGDYIRYSEELHIIFTPRCYIGGNAKIKSINFEM